MSLNDEQPKPTPNATTKIWDLVILDMAERERIGIEKYGTPLQISNGRDGLVDLYQEQLDAAVYTRALIEERARANGILGPVPPIPHRMALEAEVKRLQAREQELLDKNSELALRRQAANEKLMNASRIADKIVDTTERASRALVNPDVADVCPTEALTLALALRSVLVPA